MHIVNFENVYDFIQKEKYILVKECSKQKEKCNKQT